MGEDLGGDKIRLRIDLPSGMPSYPRTPGTMKDMRDSMVTVIL